MLGICYLLHFSHPISAAHTCQHYIGWCIDLNVRMAMHRAGKGARLTQVAVERGIGFEVVRTWPGSREFERYLKNGKRAPRLCPMCCSHHGRRCPVTRATQLELPIDDFPTLAPGRLDWLEIQIQRNWRAARPQPVASCALDDLL